MSDTFESTQAAASTSISTTTMTDPASIAIYNRGPAIAIFTPPISCLATLTYKSDMYVGHRTTGYFDPACYPSSTTDRGLAGWDLYYYSPAQCPSGWTSAATLTNSIGQFETFLTIGSDTTAIVCCPSNYRYAGAGGHQCQSAFTSTSSTLTYITPMLNGANKWTETSLINPMITIATADPDYNVYNDGIPIFYQESDLAAFASATSISSTSSSSTSSRTLSQPTPSTSSLSGSSTESTGLSTGAKIGIGVGIPLAVIALGLIGAFVWFRRRGMQRINQTELQDQSAVTNETLQHGGKGRIVSELYSDTPYDPHVPREQYELPDHGLGR